MNWTKQHPGLTMAGAMVGLLLFLWGMALPLSTLPAPIGPAAELFAEGSRVTVLLTIISGTAGVILGVVAGMGKLSKFLPLRWLCDFYVWIIRGTPLLLQILFVWLVLPAYNTECVRAGILAVPHGQIEAARALGLTPMQTFVDIILPQSLRVALPALANNLASLVKDSSLAYAISVVELTMIGYRIQAESYQPIPVFMTLAAIYLILTTAFTTLTAALESKLEVGQKR